MMINLNEQYEQILRYKAELGTHSSHLYMALRAENCDIPGDYIEILNNIFDSEMELMKNLDALTQKMMADLKDVPSDA